MPATRSRRTAPAASPFTVLDERVSLRGSQRNDYTLVVKQGEHTLKVTIHVDASVLSQTTNKVEVLDRTEKRWNHIHSLPWSHLASLNVPFPNPAYRGMRGYVGDPTPQTLRADAETLIALAVRFLDA